MWNSEVLGGGNEFAGRRMTHAFDSVSGVTPVVPVRFS